MNVTERDRMISAAIAAGKFTEKRRTHWAAAWDRDPAGTRAVIAMLTPVLTQSTGRQSGAAVRAAAPGDPLHGANPLVDSLRVNNPALYGLAMADDPHPPQMFESGDVPPFTASGMDPALLLQVPWTWRHAIAEAHDLASALHLFEAAKSAAAAGLGLAQYPDSRSLTDYRQRVSLWASGMTKLATVEPQTVAAAGPRSRPDRDRLEDEMYRSLFGQSDAVQAAAVARAQDEKAAQAAAEKARKASAAARAAEVERRAYAADLAAEARARRGY